MRAAVLLGVLAVVAITAPRERAIRFVQPKRLVVLGTPRGVVIPVQTLVARHPENRQFRLEWGGENCGGSSAVSLDGDYARALQPIEPLKVRVGYGVCAFQASVFGPGETLRARERIDVRICGDGTACSPSTY